MKTTTARASQLVMALGLIFGVALLSTASAGSVKAGAYDTAIQKGTLTEPEIGYETGYVTHILLDEDYHDWDGRITYGNVSDDLEKAEFAAFEEEFDVPWELQVVD